MNISKLLKSKRKEAGLSQEQFADRAGIALTVIRKIEQGKTNLNFETVNNVLKMFGYELGAVKIRREYEES